jgi:ribonuclease HI
VRGQSELTRAIELICRYWRDAIVLIPVATKRRLGELHDALAVPLRGQLTRARGRDWRSGTNRICCTYDALATVYADSVDVVVFSEPATMLNGKVFGAIAELPADILRYTIVQAGQKLDPASRLRLESLCGPVIWRSPDPRGEPAGVRVEVCDGPFVPRINSQGLLGRKRRAFWHNEPRNRMVAEIAAAFAAGDQQTLWQHGLGLEAGQEHPAGQRARVAVLVEGAEHGEALRKLLPGWSLLPEIADQGAETLDNQRRTGRKTPPAPHPMNPKPRGRGLPQGGCLSPILLNCYGDHFLDRCWRQTHPDVPLVRVADDLLLEARDANEAGDVDAELERLVVPAGLPLKGNPRDAIRLLGDGQHADWLGYRIYRGERGVETHVGPKSWNRLADKLTRAHAEPHAPIRAMEILEGWTEQLGACYEHEDHEAVYARIASLANQQSFYEIPSLSEFDETWEQAHVRFYHLRRVVMLRSRRGDTSRPTGNAPSPGQRGASVGEAATPASRACPRVTIFTDGSCLGSRGTGGWAFLIEGPAPGDRLYRADGHPRTTSNRMEVTAVIRGLEALDEPSLVRVVTDSQYVYRAIIERLPHWRQQGWRCLGGGQLANASLWQRLDMLLQQHEVTCEWAPGHSGLAGNEEADRLARAAALAHLTQNE